MNSAGRDVRAGVRRRFTGRALPDGFAAVCAAAAFLMPLSAAIAGGVTEAPARDVLQRHCARCHEAGQLENPPAKGALGNILDLPVLAEQPHFVRPGDPDASRLYQIMLARHRPLDTFFGPVPGPSLTEIQAVRDWIATIEVPKDGVCRDRVPVTDAEISRDVKAWLKSVAAPEAVRFISLAHLYNDCASDARLAGYRAVISALVAGLAKPGRTAAVEVLGETSTLIALRPEDAGWPLPDWDLLTGVGAREPSLADALAARVFARPDIFTASRGEEILKSQKLEHVEGLEPVAALAAEHLQDVSLERAAAETGSTAEDSARQLASVAGANATLALRLRQSGLPRGDWEVLKSALNGRPAGPVNAASPAAAIRIALWSDKETYAADELLTIQAKSSADCYLTIVAIEPDGQATVLFPNDFAQYNRVTAGQIVTVPAPGAPYQLRLDKSGRQGLAGICHAQAKRPEGIGHDFERQRFTALGNWRTFLGSSTEKEAEYQKVEENGRKFRARRRGEAAPEKPAEQLPVGTENEGRAGLTIEVK